MIRIALTIEPNEKPGGPNTFVRNFFEWVQENPHCGLVIVPFKSCADAILVIGEAGNLRLVDEHRKRGAKVVFRIDGKRRFLVDSFRTAFPEGYFKYKIFLKNVRIFFRFQVRSLRLFFIADACIFQSEYIYHAWLFGRLIRWLKPKRSDCVIYNGISIERRASRVDNKCLSCGEAGVDPLRVVAAKGWIHNTVFLGTLLNVLDSPQLRAFWLSRGKGRRILFDFYGNTTHIETMRQYWEARCTSSSSIAVCFHGADSPESVSEALGSSQAKGFLVTEDRPACPNAVIEAQINGLLVLGRRTGALGEMVYDASVLYEGSPRSHRKVFDWTVAMLNLLVEGGYSPAEVRSFAIGKYGPNRFGDYADLLRKTVKNRA